MDDPFINDREAQPMKRSLLDVQTLEATNAMKVLTFAEESRVERKTETVSLSLPSRKDQSLIKYKFEFYFCENLFIK